MTERLQAIENRLEDLGKKVEHDLREENRRLHEKNEEMQFHLKRVQCTMVAEPEE
jgi:tetrahydromethanopterin S-methyltransferase subunit G